MVEKSKSTFKSWYEKNKEVLNARRKERYHTEEDYKTAVLKRLKVYRTKGTSKGSGVSIPDREKVVNASGELVKAVNDYKQPAYNISSSEGLSLIDICSLAGISVRRYTFLRERGYILDPKDKFYGFTAVHALALSNILTVILENESKSIPTYLDKIQPYFDAYNKISDLHREGELNV